MKYSRLRDSSSKGQTSSILSCMYRAAALWSIPIFMENGAPGEDRTPDRCVRSALLCPLSYGGKSNKYSYEPLLHRSQIQLEPVKGRT